MSLCVFRAHTRTCVKHGGFFVCLAKPNRSPRTFFSLLPQAELADWWLTLIENECQKFLMKHNYVIDALPEGKRGK